MSPEASPLGKQSAYAAHYQPDLLFPIERQLKRSELGLTGPLPFVGQDIWNAYELSWLDAQGKPVVALGVFEVPADSPCIVESKSLKLYLNSLNQTRFASVAAVQDTITRDVSAIVGAVVTVRLQLPAAWQTRVLTLPAGRCLDEIPLTVEHYAPCPEALRAEASVLREDVCLYSHLLKSNCLVTGQPDWAMLGLRYSGPQIDEAGLLRYLIGFRQHNEFHEQCVERIFCEVMQRCEPTRLLVWARYTRRGGLDINPLRATDAEWAASIGNVFEARQ